MDDPPNFNEKDERKFLKEIVGMKVTAAEISKDNSRPCSCLTSASQKWILRRARLDPGVR
jgi:hypothetical protein